MTTDSRRQAIAVSLRIYGEAHDWKCPRCGQVSSEIFPNASKADREYRRHRLEWCPAERRIVLSPKSRENHGRRMGDAGERDGLDALGYYVATLRNVAERSGR